MRKINRTRLTIGLLIGFVLLVAVLASHNDNADFSPATRLSDSTPQGGRGLAIVLEKLGYTTQSVNEPIAQVPADAKLWFLLDSKTTFSDREADSLLAWVSKGGTLFWVASQEQFVFFATPKAKPGISRMRGRLGISNSGAPSFDPNGLAVMKTLNFDAVENYRVGVPGASASGTKISLTIPTQRAVPVVQIAGGTGGTIHRANWGKGHIFLFPDAWMLCNYGLSQSSNATLLANLVRVDNPQSTGGAAYFDEREHDNTLTAPEPDDWPARLRQRPVVFGIWQLMIVGLGSLVLVSRRLGSPVPLPSQPPVTRSSGFARAMGALLYKAGRPTAASQIIGESFRVRLARRVGLSPHESDDVLASRASEISSVPREVLSRALIASRAPAVTEATALRDAQEMERILEELA